MINRSAPPPAAADLLTTQHLGPFLVVLAVGMVIGALAVIALLAGVLDDEPTTDDVEPLTERLAPVPSPVDLPRREWSL